MKQFASLLLISTLQFVALHVIVIDATTLQCPSGTTQIGGLNADIGGCGLEGCDARYQDNYANINQCKAWCDIDTRCVSFSWAPLNGDKNHPGKTVCTLYDSTISNQVWGPQQILCALVTISPTSSSPPTTRPPTNRPTYPPSFRIPSSAPTSDPTYDPTSDPTPSPITSGPSFSPTVDPTKSPTPVSCADPTTAIEVIAGAIYACPGTIASGGTYGLDAHNLCGEGYSVCESATRAAELGLTINICTDNTIFTNINQFFGTRESSHGHNWQCESQYGRTNGELNDIWGCGNSGIVAGTYMNKNASCSVNGNVIFQYAIGNGDWNDWDFSGNGRNEAETYALTDSASGGVLCCKNIMTQGLVCPAGTEQVGDLNADIGGCGLEGCNARYQNNYANIDECKAGCDNDARCESLSWAPLNGDKYHPGKTVCTLYDSDVPNRVWGPQQILCAEINNAYVYPNNIEIPKLVFLAMLGLIVALIVMNITTICCIKGKNKTNKGYGVVKHVDFDAEYL